MRKLLPALVIAALCAACESVPGATSPNAIAGTGGVASADGKVANGSGVQQSGATTATARPVTWHAMQGSTDPRVAPPLDQTQMARAGSMALEATTSQAAMNAAHNAMQVATPVAPSGTAPLPGSATTPMMGAPAPHESFCHEMHETRLEEAREHGHR